MIAGQLARDDVRRDVVAHAHVQVISLRRHVDQAVEHLEADLHRGMLGGERR